MVQVTRTDALHRDVGLAVPHRSPACFAPDTLPNLGDPPGGYPSPGRARDVWLADPPLSPGL